MTFCPSDRLEINLEESPVPSEASDSQRVLALEKELAETKARLNSSFLANLDGGKSFEPTDTSSRISAESRSGENSGFEDQEENMSEHSRHSGDYPSEKDVESSAESEDLDESINSVISGQGLEVREEDEVASERILNSEDGRAMSQLSSSTSVGACTYLVNML